MTMIIVVVLIAASLLRTTPRRPSLCYRPRKPAFREWDGKGSLLSFVISLNLFRRHLNESQRAMVAAKLAELEQGANQHRSIDLPSQAQAAEMLNVSRPSVQRARKIRESGDEKLIADVESGKVTVSAAATVASSISGNADTPH